uniref:Adenosine kinase n=1 Tax=Globisporangium ultimum (strain ATCC 200006 / CBS 805.95 / DAOM BR144) TaxID=431595 RepID=K3WYU1_GLOUD
MKVAFAVLGDSFVDVVAGTLAPDQLPKWGGDIDCSLPIQLQPGGSALNTATHIGKLAIGNPCHEFCITLHTVVGTDAFAPVLKSHLDSHGVALSSPMIDGVPTGVCIVLSGTQDRSFITHYGAARKFNVEHIDEEKVLAADHLHIGGFYSCSNLQGNLKPLLEKAHAKGITISLDTNYDSSEAWSGLQELLPLLDVFLPNEVEAMKISRTDSVDAAMAYFTQHVPGLTVIKIGEGGARAHCAKTNTTWMQGSFQTQVVDVTGAGDSFNAGFLSMWKATNGDVQEALKWGCATASKCVSALGACSLQSTYDDVNAVILQGTLNA